MLVALIAIIGAFMQELVPFPSILVFAPVAATLQAAGVGLWSIVLLSLSIGVARVLAGLLVYAMSEKLYAVLYRRRTSWFGVRRSQLTHVRVELGKNGGWWAIFVLWVLPIVPSTLIPLSAGFVRLPVRTFATATYAGSVINALSYLLVGYYGLQGAIWLWG